jgi:spermidine/putrescine ABC transporter ATP-binding subunit
MSDAVLRLENLVKSFGAVMAVAGVNLEIQRGEFVTLLGPSGCGKSTTLNLIAGFFPPTSGTIHLNGRDVNELPPFHRDTGMVFQDYALFPHMSVEENVAFGLRMRKAPRREVAGRVARALTLVKLEGLGARRPAQLSGGQQQRVALARAIVIEPSVLLLDEPLSNLDMKLREEMRIEISNIQKAVGITTVFVTHDQGEALVMSDRIAVMNGGRIEQVGPPVEIYERPATRFVAEFIGRTNFFYGRLEGEAGRVRFRSERGLELTVPPPAGLGPGQPVHVSVRPERCRLARDRHALRADLVIAGRVQQVVYLGAVTQYLLELEHAERGLVELQNVGRDVGFRAGEEVFLGADLRDCLLLPAQS